MCDIQFLFVGVMWLTNIYYCVERNLQNFIAVNIEFQCTLYFYLYLNNWYWHIKVCVKRFIFRLYYCVIEDNITQNPSKRERNKINALIGYTTSKLIKRFLYVGII